MFIKYFILFLLIFFSLNTITFVLAEEEKAPTPEMKYPRYGINIFKNRYYVINHANDETFSFPFHGAGFSFLLQENFSLGARLFSSEYITQYSGGGNPYHHYFWGMGMEARYTFWNIFYLKGIVDILNYSVKNQALVDEFLFFNTASRSGFGAIGSLGLGINFMLWNHAYIYAGKYTTYGRVGTQKTVAVDAEGGGTKYQDVLDEAFDFTCPNNYEFGMTIYF